MTSNANPGQFCWNELMTSDTGKAKDFYTKLFGWTTQVHEMKDMTYTMFKQNDQDVGGMLQIPADKVGMVPPHWMSYILVSNVDEMTQKAATLGAQVKVPVTPIEGIGKFSVLMDPTGAHIALWESASR